ncbi:MAG: branched-chain amino acid transaminase [Deltaproteobacteria bacterium]|nr:branched-chain amino acid transaminase [Deltaproteobacteria bacterium]
MFDHETLKVFFRGDFVDFNQATISVANTGFLYGLGVFSGIRAHCNKEEDRLYLFRPDEHYKRFRAACKLCRYENFLSTYDYAAFLRILVTLIQVNNIREDVYIRVGNFSDENRITPKFVGYRDSLCAFLYPLGDYIPTTGMRCKVSSWTRVEDNAIPARAKFNGAYINTAFAKTEALLDGYDEAIVLDSRGHVVEGSAENIFVVIDGKLITPPVTDNILEGITRKTVLEIAAAEGITTVERTLDRTELYKADEIFLTGTGAKVSPVTEVDKLAIADGKVGMISSKIQSIYFAAVRGEVEKYKHWLIDVYKPN